MILQVTSQSAFYLIGGFRAVYIAVAVRTMYMYEPTWQIWRKLQVKPEYSIQNWVKLEFCLVENITLHYITLYYLQELCYGSYGYS